MSKLNRRSFIGLAATTAAAGVVPVAEAADACRTGVFAVPRKWDETVELLVVGSGGAGLASAVSARQNGVKQVLVLEKLAFIGGNTMISGGAYNACDPVRQPKQGIKDSPELHAQNTWIGGDGRADPELVKTLAENAYAGLTWLESLGMEFKPTVYQVYGGLYPRAHDGLGNLGAGYIKVLDAAQKKIGGIEIRTKCRVTRVIREEPLAGRVLGVEYTAPDGSKKTVRAKRAVVLATGGFGANAKLRAKYDPRMLNLTTTNNPAVSTGDLIDPMIDIGADVVGMDHIQCNPGCPPGRKHRVIMHLYPQYFLLVNKEYKRFVAEDSRRDVVRDAILSQTGQMAYGVIDKKAWDNINPGHRASITKGFETGDAWMGNTIEEAAKNAGLDPKQFAACIEKFNKGVETKNDEFGKLPRNLFKMDTPPFYIGLAGMSVHHTMGGLRINKHNQVIDRRGNVIPGVYAVGEVSGGIHGSNRLGGNAIADIFTFGRLTGIYIGKNEKAK